MPKQSISIPKLREQLAQTSKDWLKDYAPNYLDQKADWKAVSPDKFIQVKQYQRWKEKTFGEIDEQEEFTRMGIFQAIEKNPQL